jgi:hypothetical protein
VCSLILTYFIVEEALRVVHLLLQLLDLLRLKLDLQAIQPPAAYLLASQRLLSAQVQLLPHRLVLRIAKLFLNGLQLLG